jgi:ribonuclease E
MADPKRQIVINYVPGEECRVAVLLDGKLDEFYSERFDQISHVGNIYVGKVTNVEPAIQAAFVDFGLPQAGFLHVTDLHPMYFGDEDNATERVGKKTPRRERPPIQEALKRGQEIVVQVLKEGVGSKGPSVTSYLSIPGRYLVMMPGMDRVGVSRKVEDEELRAKMKDILDQLELPDGFGFILRTAGLERNKTELKRDLAYLLRLQKDMERRRLASNKPRLLYSESDLLLRSLRDLVTAETDSIIIDSEQAIKRAARFMKIVAPRTLTKLVHYTGRAPVFHALNVEERIRSMYTREVPLPSGGRLVIDETEALVAIDVNSGKSRSAGDSEENAFRTNLEAAEEICRQLRLRDLGGIVVNDLIDMRMSKHRKEIEAKFEDLLKDDRAKSTVAPISEFGILEMTRQRMRGSHESIHFHTCPTCHGRGKVQKPDSVAADALRQLAALLDHDKVAKVELVVHPRVGGELLSSKRRTLHRLERRFKKVILVRLSDAVAFDRVTFYAYEADGADIEIDRLPKPRAGEDVLVPYNEPGVTDVEEIEHDEGDWSAELDREETSEDHDEDQDDQPPAPEMHLMETEPGEGDLDGVDFNLAAMRRARGGKRGRRGRGSDRPERADRPDRQDRDRRESPAGDRPQPPQRSAEPAHAAAHHRRDDAGDRGEFPNSPPGEEPRIGFPGGHAGRVLGAFGRIREPLVEEIRTEIDKWRAQGIRLAPLARLGGPPDSRHGATVGMGSFEQSPAEREGSRRRRRRRRGGRGRGGEDGPGGDMPQSQPVGRGTDQPRGDRGPGGPGGPGGSGGSGGAGSSRDFPRDDRSSSRRDDRGGRQGYRDRDRDRGPRRDDRGDRNDRGDRGERGDRGDRGDAGASAGRSALADMFRMDAAQAPTPAGGAGGTGGAGDGPVSEGRAPEAMIESAPTGHEPTPVSSDFSGERGEPEPDDNTNNDRGERRGRGGRRGRGRGDRGGDRDDRGGRGGSGGGRSGQPAPSSGNSSAPATGSTPAPTPSSANTPKPAAPLLYSRNRRLKPGEAKGGKREE